MPWVTTNDSHAPGNWLAEASATSIQKAAQWVSPWYRPERGDSCCRGTATGGRNHATRGVLGHSQDSLRGLPKRRTR